MGQSVCSGNHSQNSQLKNMYTNHLQFQHGQDTKQSKINHHSDQIKTKSNQIENILNECTQKLKASKLMYKDPTMPTDKLVLKSLTKDTKQKKQIQAVYCRPYQFLNIGSKQEPYKIIDSHQSSANYIFVNDQVMQYFGVFLCFLADHPKIVEEIILTEPSTYGIHAVQINVQRKRVPIFIDDYILCANSRPLFTQPVKNIYLWPNLIQKVWFKTHGFTQKIIERNTPQQVFESFLNHPLKRISLEGIQDYEKIQLIKQHLHNLNPDWGYILTSKKDPRIHLGISGRKYLYFIGSFQYQNKRLFYMRNPYQKFTFRGTYDQISQDLKAKVLQQFQTTHIPQGNFILDDTQFLEQISSFSIFYYSKSSKITNFQIQLENNNEIFIQTQLKTAGLLSLCFRQQTNRRTDNKFSPITYQVIDTNSGEIVGGQSNEQGCFGFRNSYLFSEVIKKLPQSKYLIRLKKKDKKKHYAGIKSALIATFPLQLKFDIKNQSQFTDIFLDMILNAGKKQYKASKKSKRGQVIQHQVYMIGDLICIYIIKTNEKLHTCKVQVTFPQLKNLQMIYPEIDLAVQTVLPQEMTRLRPQQIIIFQKIDLVGETQLGFFQLEAF